MTRLAPGEQVLVVFDGFELPTAVHRGGLQFPDGSIGGQIWSANRPFIWEGPYTTWWWHPEVLLDPKEPWASGRYSDRWTINGTRYEITFDVTGNGRMRTPTPVATISPASGPRGTSFTYLVSGFPPSIGLTQVIRFPDGSTMTSTLRSAASGQAMGTIHTDPLWAAGPHTITITGGGLSRQLTFTVTR